MPESNIDHLVSLGTPGDSLEIVPASPDWLLLFEREAARVHDACDEWIERIEHIGSTAVPGLAAKPILDLMPGLRSYEDGERCIEPMTQLGYVHHGEYGIAGRRFFTLNHHGCRVAHVHMFVIDCQHWSRHLAFRDALRRDPPARDRYQTLKRQLADCFPHDRERYASEKGPFIASLVDGKLHDSA